MSLNARAIFQKFGLAVQAERQADVRGVLPANSPMAEALWPLPALAETTARVAGCLRSASAVQSTR